MDYDYAYDIWQHYLDLSSMYDADIAYKNTCDEYGKEDVKYVLAYIGLDNYKDYFDCDE